MSNEWPKFLMKIGEEIKWLSIQEAGTAYDSGWINVEIRGEAKEQDGTIRPITEEERQKISGIADAYSANK